MLTLSTARGLGISLGTPARDGKSLQLVGMVTGAPSKKGKHNRIELKLLLAVLAVCC